MLFQLEALIYYVIGGKKKREECMKSFAASIKESSSAT
jgi:hypothetical protein